MIITKTPFRISFMGGGTDFRDYYRTSPGMVISTAINKYMYITVKRRFEDTFRISYHRTEITNRVGEIEHPIVREALKVAGIIKGIEVTSIGDIPAGTGLGSSSSFTVGLLNALFALKGELKTAEELARLACKIEIDILKEPIGKQDQYIAAYGGLKRVQFNPDESVYVDPLVTDPKTLNRFKKNLLVFYTGKSRSASRILCDQKNNCRRNGDFLDEMKALAEEFHNCLAKDRDHSRLGKLLNRSWVLKKELAHQVSNKHIDQIYSRAIKSGALGGKVLGAGGGGFMLFFCPVSAQDKLRYALRKLKELDFELETQGSKIIYVGGD